MFYIIIDFLFKCTNNFFKLIGPLFSIIIINFFIYTYISIIKNIFPFWYEYYYSFESKTLVYIIYKSIITIELLYCLFNNILSLIIKPGSIFDIRKSQYYKTHNPYYSDKLLFPISSIDANKSINDSINNINVIVKDINVKSKNIMNKNYNWEICKICKEIKPLRTHHCTICGFCVIKMDHHCPWINNCIGQNNHRYFLLFLFHSFLYTFFSTIFILPVFFKSKKLNKKKDLNISQKYFNFNENEINYLGTLGIICVIIELFFSGWHWYLALDGNTTIEYWSKRSDYEIFKGIDDYSFGSRKKNIYYIFGTTNIFKIFFGLNIKKLPFSGLEISKYLDPEFSIDLNN